ncbi:RecQ family ATP-dependent DNA helicase [Chryseolinea sp. H1M3-3]|uniref:RecQ family ATP-dependent DNA helicase n=1 Tax=Chryseolinea sp. H1M3-3 TaxID=3034144 RepID=UPI0023ECDA90|nr:RecQ family ATP-dependent DNA helicase [Chryseolinea sp. H1M3-3]
MNRQQAEAKLQALFKLDKFYDEQWDTIDRMFKGERVLLIERTGFGKSLCYQFPATQFSGITVIFSPLIALMRDQVSKLNALGIKARCINSEQTPEENSAIIKDATQNLIKILYIAPERQENEEWITATQKMKLSMVVIDEAHCISVWGHDFRPAFRRIVNLVNLLPKDMPILATTATATKKVEDDISTQIHGSLNVIRGNLLRENLQLFVLNVQSEDEKLVWLGQNLLNVSGSGLIYTGTKANTKIYSQWLEFLKIPSTWYNADLDADSRIEIEEGLKKNKWKCVVSTNALGMGIDKSDIRFIIHTQVPQSPIHYYQEIGRAGRDGKPALIILFYNEDDKALPEAFIDGGRPPVSMYEKVINVIKQELVGEQELMKKANMKQTQVRVIKADLIDQGIIREVLFGGRKKYEYIVNAPSLNTKAFEELRAWKKTDLDNMLQYVHTTKSRMNFLCEYLGDVEKGSYNNCDNSGLEKLVVKLDSEWKERLQRFREEYFPELEVESKYSNLVNGVAASYYGVSNVGRAIHRSKYEAGGDFPDFLIKLTLQAIRKTFGSQKFDLILFMPPTKSGDLVKNFATKISGILKIPISNSLVKVKTTQEQKVFENNLLKEENVKDAFTFKGTETIAGQTILLIDDVFDSGKSIREVGKLLTKMGAAKIVPVVIAKTVGGDL